MEEGVLADDDDDFECLASVVVVGWDNTMPDLMIRGVVVVVTRTGNIL